MKRKRWPRKLQFSIWRLLLPIMLIAALLAVGSGYRRLRELIGIYGENRCRNLVTQLLLDAAAQEKTTEKLSSFTTVDGKVVLQMNSEVLRQYQAAVGNHLTQQLNSLGEQLYQVPLGTVLESVLFMERGPQVSIRFVPVGAAQITIGSTLEEAGVNQVLYQVIMELSVDMTVLLPGGTRQVSCVQPVILEETLLTGDIPFVYGG